MQNPKLVIFMIFFFNEKINVVAFYSIKTLIESIFFLQKNVTDYVYKTLHYFIDKSRNIVT